MTTYPNLRQLADERVALINGVLPKVVGVLLGRRRTLSGIRWRGDLIVTAADAVAEVERVSVVIDGLEKDAEVVAIDLGTAIAVLRIATGADSSQSNQVPVESANAPDSLLRTGEPIAMIGYTQRGLGVLWGNVLLAGPAWNSRRGGKIAQRLELDVRFDGVFEGAAVIDMTGRVAAMAVPGPRAQVLGIPAATIESVVNQVEQHGHLPKPYIGVRLQPLWLDDHTRAQLGRASRAIAAVGGVDEGSPAAEAHVQLGDLLLTLDGEPAENATALAQRIASISPGNTIALEVLRGGQPLVIKVKVGERPRH